MSRQIIVHADDFGLHPAINDGIETAYRQGMVTSASIMPEGPAFNDAVLRSRDMPGLDIGLHFALVGVAGMPPTLSAFLQTYLSGGMPPRVVAEAFRRQIDAARSAGLSLSHLDSHQHLHALPGLMRVVCPLAAEHGLRAIRLPVDGPAFTPISPARRVQAAVLAVMARLSRHCIAAYGLHTSDHFSGMAVSGHLTAPVLTSYLTNAQMGLTEIVCHPGAENIALRAVFPWGYDWEGERAALCSAEAKQGVEAGGVKLIGWGGV